MSASTVTSNLVRNKISPNMAQSVLTNNHELFYFISLIHSKFRVNHKPKKSN